MNFQNSGKEVNMGAMGISINNSVKSITKEVKNTQVESIEARPRKYNETNFSIMHKKVKDRVLSILRGDKYARQNDFYLCLVYWIKCGFIKTEIDLKDLQNITKPESISRVRRELITQAKKGDAALQFLLKDEETLNERENLNQLNQGYYNGSSR